MPILPILLAFFLVSIPFVVRADFTAEGCPAWKPSEFRYVKVVTKAVDPELNEPIKVALHQKAEGQVDIYFVERHGKVKRWNAATQTVTTLATLDLWTDSPARKDTVGDAETGLEGIALDPKFSENHRLYLRYEPWSKSVYRISRFEVKGDALDMASEKILLEIPYVREHTRLQPIVLGGAGLAFDGAGNLLIAIGANSELSPSVNEKYRDFSAEYTASNLRNLRGSILRIKPDDSPRGYAIPDGNFGAYWSAEFRKQGNAAVADQYADTSMVKPEIYIKGVRNPYALSVDPVRNWVSWGEFGPNRMGVTRIEEDNIATHPSYGGYPYWAGKHAFLLEGMQPWAGAGLDPKAPRNTSVWNDGPKDLPPADTPRYAYSAYLNNGFIVGNHPIAGPLYHYDPASGSGVKLPPHFDKAWFMTDRVSGVRVLQLDATGSFVIDSAMLATEQKLDRPLDLQQGPDGALYVVDYGAGWHSTTANTHIGRIEYTGTCRPGAPTALRAAAAAKAGLRLARGRILLGAPGAHHVRVTDSRGRETAQWRGFGPREYELGKSDQAGVRIITVTWPGEGRTVSAITASP